MTMETAWQLKDRVITLRIAGTVSADEVYITNRALDAYLCADSGLPIHILIDETDLDSTPHTRDLLDCLARSGGSNIGWIATYGNTTALSESLLWALSTVLNAPAFRFETREEALAFLSDMDLTLPETWSDQRLVVA